jgi:glucose-6-phosphate dehydrogenase assembly protein OpcA
MTERERALTATVVAIVSPASRQEACDTLSALSHRAGVRPIIISLGGNAEPPRREEDGAVVIDGLVPKYLDNAVASLRLSSLPAIAWWRARELSVLTALTGLVDRVVLDLPDPADAWALVPDLAEHAPVSDIRWARLTRWRDLVAQFFDMPEVRAGTWTHLAISGSDPFDARLMTGWLQSRLQGGREIAAQHLPVPGERLQSIELTGDRGRLVARLLPNGSCIETGADLWTGHVETRVVTRGDERLPALLGQELRVRSRDLAFEDAVRELERT